MPSITAFLNKNSVNIKQTRVKREWMDKTFSGHAYRCFPLSLANSIGYELSLPEDVTFIWDGIDDTSPDHIKILKGMKYCNTSRANATLSLKTGIVFKTDKNISMMHMPVPNLFNNEYQTYTSIISTSFYDIEFPSAIKVTIPNKEITIKANHPFATIIPISLSNMSNIELNIESFDKPKEYYEHQNEKMKMFDEITSKGDWTDWYRNGLDHNGNIIGEHEVKNLKLKINDMRDNDEK
jgi:hypothetical protein